MTTDVTTPPPTRPDPEPGNFLTRGPSIKWPVFGASLIGVVAVALWAIIAPDAAYDTIYSWTVWVGSTFGWFYITLGTAILVFVLFLGISRFGTMRLGPEHSRPEFSTFAWASMLFAAGIGTDVMFFSVVEPVTQYVAPPVGRGETVEAAREATVWTLFHYGITGWGMYALMGMALGFFAYRLNLPLAVRSALYPIFGKRIDGVLGHAVDTAAVLGTIFGVATSLGIGVVFLNFGLNELFGVPIGLAAQIALAALAVTVAAISATTGVDKGIRFLSQLNVILALALASWVLVTGKTEMLLEGVVMNVGDFVASFPGLTMDTMAFDQANEWMNLWTLFFWAWWVAWASFVGLFLARISRGRTIRQFVAGTMIIPFAYIVMWVSIFGNAALDRVRGGDADFAEAAQNYDGRGFFMLVEQYPAAGVVIAVATFVGLLFYITSADSGRAGHGQPELAPAHRARGLCGMAAHRVGGGDRTADHLRAGGRRHLRPAVRHGHHWTALRGRHDPGHVGALQGAATRAAAGGLRWLPPPTVARARGRPGVVDRSDRSGDQLRRRRRRRAAPESGSLTRPGQGGRGAPGPGCLSGHR